MAVWELTLRLAAVAAVFALAMWALRRYAARQPKKPNGIPRSMRVVSKVVLGRGSQVVLVDVGGQPFLVGVNAQAVPVPATPEDFDQHTNQAIALASSASEPPDNFEAVLRSAITTSQLAEQTSPFLASNLSDGAPATLSHVNGQTASARIPAIGVSRQDRASAKSFAEQAGRKAPSKPRPAAKKAASAKVAASAARQRVPQKQKRDDTAQSAQPRSKSQAPPKRSTAKTSAGKAAVKKTAVKTRTATKSTPSTESADPAVSSSKRAAPARKPRPKAVAKQPSHAKSSRPSKDFPAEQPQRKIPAEKKASLETHTVAAEQTDLPKLPPPPATRDVTFSLASDRYRQTLSGPPAGKGS